MSPFHRSRITLAATLLGLLASSSFAQTTRPAADEIIPEFGKFTHTYMSDWSKLPIGDQIARRDISKISFKEVTGEETRQHIHDQDRVVIKDLHLKVKWNRDKYDKKETTLFFIENCKEVVLENVSIVAMDGDYRMYHDFLIEGAEKVTVRNLYLAGSVQSHHLRMEGCGQIFVENVEIAGIDYYNTGKHRLGGGIWINNGDNTKAEGINGTGMYATQPKLPGWQIVQNCYIHDASEDDNTGRNQDAILIHAPGNGIIFNCVVENWLNPAVDASFDVGFRRVEPEYQDHYFRVERNVVKNSTFVKTPGTAAPGPNATLFANNLFVNTQYADYHKPGADVFFVHNTFIYDLDKAPAILRPQAMRGSDGYAVLWSFTGRSFMENCLLYKPSGNFFMFYMNNQESPNKYRNFFLNHNLYAFGKTQTSWLRSAADGMKLKTFEDWKKDTHQDSASKVVTGVTPDLFVNYAAGDYRPRAISTDLKIADPASLKNADPRLAVTRDFNGNPRAGAKTLVPGAFCATAE